MKLKINFRKAAAVALAAAISVPTVLMGFQPYSALADTVKVVSTDTGYHSVSTSVSEAKAGDLFVAPNATGDGSSEASPMGFAEALKKVQAGNTIWVKAGTYPYSESVIIAEDNSGAADAYKSVVGYGGAVVVDFSAMALDSANRGLILDGSYWHMYGITFKGAGDNGMLLSGDNNIVEMCIFTENRDTGLQLSRYNTSYANMSQWPSNNLIKNCTSYNNCDKSGENADGFAAKLTCGEGNVFDGCMSYNNSDDGWDLYAKTATGPIGVVTIKNSIAFRNGKLTSGEGSASGDMNGFKLGGSGVATPHVIYNCIAFENGAHGFTDNNNPEALVLKNCTSFNNSVYSSGNKGNFTMSREKGGVNSNLLSYTTRKISTDAFIGTVASSVYYSKDKSVFYSITDKTAFNGKEKLGTIVTVSDSDFVSITAPDVSTDFHTAWRDADGSINTHGFLEVAQSSQLAKMADDGKALGARFTESSSVVAPSEPESTTQAPTESGSAAETSASKPGESATEAPTQKPSESATEAPTQSPVAPYRVDLDLSAGLLAGQTYGREDIADVTVLADMAKKDSGSYTFEGVEYKGYVQGSVNASPKGGKIPTSGSAVKISAKTTGKVTFVLNSASSKKYHFVRQNADGSASDLKTDTISETGPYVFDVEAGFTYYFYADGSKPMIYAIVLSGGSETSVKPTEAETSVKPTEAETSVKPTEAETSVKPTEAETSVKPTEAETSAKPTEAETSAKPTEAETSVKPTEAETSVKPTEAETSAKPTEAETSAKPTEAETSAKPAETETQTQAPTISGDKIDVSGDNKDSVKDVVISGDVKFEGDIKKEDVKLVIEKVAEAVSQTVEKAVKEVLKSAGISADKTVSKYYDISLKSGDTTVKLESGKVQITFAWEAGKNAQNSDVKVYHYNNDKLEEVTPVLTEDGITIQAESFSPYVVVYAEKAATQPGTQAPAGDAPNTADTAPVMLYALICAAMAGTGAVFSKKRKMN